MGIFGCIGKVQFVSFQDAERAAKRRGGRNDQLRGRQAYHCRQCGKHHIGHANRDQRDKRLLRAQLLEREALAS